MRCEIQERLFDNSPLIQRLLNEPFQRLLISSPEQKQKVCYLLTPVCSSHVVY